MARLQINPGPLRVVERRELATVTELADSVRCTAITNEGDRCKRIQEPESRFCWQHDTGARP